jgi:hypothetical protein
MNRISERVSAAIAGVKCPGCGEYVIPSELPMADAVPVDEGGPGKRWSFIWRPPSGRLCPKCNFPLERYARRAPWIRLFVAGVVLLTTTVLLIVLAMMSGFSRWLVWAQRVTGAVGLVSFLTGLAGIVLGGRHGPESEPRDGS